jgi:hypothetical protein
MQVTFEVKISLKDNREVKDWDYDGVEKLLAFVIEHALDNHLEDYDDGLPILIKKVTITKL